MTIRLLLVDDQSLVRQGLKALLKLDQGLEVVGEAGDGQAAIVLVETLQPDVVLMDIRMPGMDGVAATRAICQKFPTARVLILTTFDDEVYVTQALQYGASGYLLKDTPLEELAQAIRFAHKGYTQLGPGLAPKAITQPQTPAPTEPPGWEELTPREQDIVRLIAQGASNREIGQALFIAEKTVRNHITHILSQLNLRDRTQLAILVCKNLWN
ncbi:DNA-binding response regulator [Leptolyngbya sp. 'hensonii']|uniref:response regulator n=1 Tax=Leptolyngbya sp. 'hensonii' TaxID=1922337 RepID=UPI00094F4FE4|nr:response regulator transcription factor [Leptolyngbya sp. 'hensonii']OLP15722.1 DNA-binding response regulator [Leptolyngbya sp. 'hensonii']